MKLIKNIVNDFSKKSRNKRAIVFKSNFTIDENTKILDLGSETGANINAVLSGTRVSPENVYIADINRDSVLEGAKKYGFTPVFISESGGIPFDDGFFDIVYCSSVIEHVTIPKNRVWETKSGRDFFRESMVRQTVFAKDIQRLGKQYFVQTPYRYYPIESHSWLPFVGWLPRRLLLPVLKITNLFWVKYTDPDWNLLNSGQMKSLFSNSYIVKEKTLGLTKSIMAIKSHSKEAL